MNYTNYNGNRKWADKKMEKVIGKLEAIFEGMENPITDIKEADVMTDKFEAADLIAELASGRSVTIGVRVRDHEAYTKFHDITIRSKYKDSNVNTELDKLRKGYCRYIFYAWMSEDNEEIIEYVFLDCDKIRKSRVLYQYKYDIPNPGEAESYFRSWSIEELKSKYEYDCVTAHWTKEEW